jgi:hypothetical protein
MQFAHLVPWQNVLCVVLGVVMVRIGIVGKEFRARFGGPIPAWQGKLLAFAVGGAFLLMGLFVRHWH